MTMQNDKLDDVQFKRMLTGASSQPLEPDSERLLDIRAKSLAAFEIAQGGKHTRSSTLARLRRALLPLAIALAIVAGIALIPIFKLQSSSVVLAEASQRLRTAKTLHWRDVLVDAYGSREDPNLEQITTETWLDLETGRYRRKYLGTAVREDGNLINDGEVVFDGEYTLIIYNSRQEAGYWRPTTVKKEMDLIQKSNQFLANTGMSDPERLRTFTKSGSEAINDELCDIWKGTIMTPSHGSGDRSVTAWLVHATGDLSRLEVLATDQGPPAMGFKQQTFEVIERDLEFPENLFAVEPPPGSILLNTKETAEPVRFSNGFRYGGGGFLYSIDVVFALNDGSLIVAWHNVSDKINQAKVFRGLESGGPLPRFPRSIHSIKTIGVTSGEVLFHGVHLINTILDGQYYAWSLFVPRGSVPPADEFFGYTFQYYTVNDELVPQLHPTPKPEAVDLKPWVIHNDDEFNRFVLGTIADYSDTGEAPEGIAADSIRQMTDEIRKTL